MSAPRALDAALVRCLLETWHRHFQDTPTQLRDALLVPEIAFLPCSRNADALARFLLRAHAEVIVPGFQLERSRGLGDSHERLSYSVIAQDLEEPPVERPRVPPFRFEPWSPVAFVDAFERLFSL